MRSGWPHRGEGGLATFLEKKQGRKKKNLESKKIRLSGKKEGGPRLDARGEEGFLKSERATYIDVHEKGEALDLRRGNVN